jgi:hypothetical protein
MRPISVKKQTSTFLLAVSILVLSVSIDVPRAYACSCLPPGPAVRSYFNYDAVFSGRVTDVVPPEPRGNIASSADPVSVHFEIYKSYKGVSGKNITVTTAPFEAICGYNFEKGNEYLVYADKNNSDYLSVNLCSNTSLLSESKSDVALFNTIFFFGPLTPLLLLVIVLFIGYKIMTYFRKKPVV